MKKLKLPVLFALISVFACTLCAQTAPAGSPVDIHGKLNVVGNRIVGQKSGEPVQLRGMSFFWNVPGWGGEGFYTAGAVNTLADDWRTNVVRVAVSPNRTNNQDFITVINAAIAKGIYVVIDFHTHDYTDRANAQTFFTRMSGLYRGVPNVIYEIFNEPCPQGGYGTSSESTCRGDDWATHVKPYSDAVVKTIRDLNDDAIIVIGTPDYSKRVDQASRNPVTGTNLVYAVHYYTAEPGTQHQSQLRSWCTIALDAGQALLVTEFGVSEADGGMRNQNNVDTLEANIWFRFLDRYSIGWMNWSVLRGGQASAALAGSADFTGSNWTGSNLSTSGAYIRNKARLYGDPTRQNYTLTVNTVGQGTVTRSFTKSGYRYGQHVELTAVPAQGWVLSGWSGGGDDIGSGKLLVGMYANQNITATFILGGNILQNGDFSGGTNSWHIEGNLNINPSNAMGPVTNNQLTLTYNTPVVTGDQVGHAWLFQRDLEFKNNRRYRLSFDARSAQPREIAVTVCNNTGRAGSRYLYNPSNPGLANNRNAYPICLTNTLQSFSVEFDMTQDQTNGRVEFWYGGSAANWFLTNVRLAETGAATGAPPSPVPACGSSSLLPQVQAAGKTVWSITRTGGGLQLSGPAQSGERVSLYDVRGRLVTHAPLKSGQVFTLSKTVAPAGNYLLVVRNSSGKDVYKTRVLLVN